MATAAEVIAGTAAWGVDCSDALAGLRGLPDGCVQCCITSPPFYALRDYGTATWEGGSPDCDHKGAPKRTQAGFNERYFGRPAGDDKQGELREPYRSLCGKCGARRVDQQIGLEDSPSAYVARLVEVFREVRRILHPTGLLLLNLGDSFAGGGGGNYTKGVRNNSGQNVTNVRNRPDWLEGAGVKAKDLLGIPWLVAFALRDDGWYLRCAPPWVKDNCMPESVTDRPTTAHEYWFLLAKGPAYFWDADAVRVPHETKPQRRLVSPRGEKAMSARGAADAGFARYTSAEPTTYGHPAGRNLRTSDVFYQGLDNLIERERAWLAHLEHVRAQGGMLLDREGDPLALCYPTFAFPGSHFATFSPHMITPLLKAATSERGCCPACRAPWVRQTERRPVPRIGHVEPCRMGQSSAGAKGNIGLPGGGAAPQVVTTGWQPSCACGAPEGVLPDDLDLIATPMGKGTGRDGWQESGRPRPCRPTGGSGYERPRAEDEGVRLITEYERRAYASQLRDAPEDVRAAMTAEVGPEAFAHYRKPGRASGRPLPADVLGGWLERGWLRRVEVPSWEPPAPVPCLILDPFCGSGTVGLVARRLGRRFVGFDLSAEYVRMARDRIEGDAPLFNGAAPVPAPAPPERTLFDPPAPKED
jgi:hypothetical protein